MDKFIMCIFILCLGIGGICMMVAVTYYSPQICDYAEEMLDYYLPNIRMSNND